MAAIIVFASSCVCIYVCVWGGVLVSYLRYLCLFACGSRPTRVMLYLCFVFLRLVYHMLPVSLDSPFAIAPSVFSDIYLVNIIFTCIWRANCLHSAAFSLYLPRRILLTTSVISVSLYSAVVLINCCSWKRKFWNITKIIYY